MPQNQATGGNKLRFQRTSEMAEVIKLQTLEVLIYLDVGAFPSRATS